MDAAAMAREVLNYQARKAAAAVQLQHGGLKGPYRKWTPAMAAGLTKELWDHDRLLDEVDSYWEAKEPPGESLPVVRRGPLPISGLSFKPYLVLHRFRVNEAKVHKASCRLCRQGQGMRERPGQNPWYEFDDIAEARRFAKRIEPGRDSDCAMCMKEMQPRLRRRI